MPHVGRVSSIGPRPASALQSHDHHHGPAQQTNMCGAVSFLSSTLTSAWSQSLGAFGRPASSSPSIGRCGRGVRGRRHQRRTSSSLCTFKFSKQKPTHAGVDAPSPPSARSRKTGQCAGATPPPQMLLRPQRRTGSKQHARIGVWVVVVLLLHCLVTQAPANLFAAGQPAEPVKAPEPRAPREAKTPEPPGFPVPPNHPAHPSHPSHPAHAPAVPSKKPEAPMTPTVYSPGCKGITAGSREPGCSGNTKATVVLLEAEPFSYSTSDGDVLGFFPELLYQAADAAPVSCDDAGTVVLQRTARCKRMIICDTVDHMNLLFNTSSEPLWSLVPVGSTLIDGQTNFTLPFHLGVLFPINQDQVFTDFLWALMRTTTVASVVLVAYVLVLTHIMYVILNFNYCREGLGNLFSCCLPKPDLKKFSRPPTGTDPDFNLSGDLNASMLGPPPPVDIPACEEDRGEDEVRITYFGGGLMDCLWWCFAATTTLGVSDKTPKGTVGRLFGMIVMCSSCIIASMYTSIIMDTMSSSQLGDEIAEADSVIHRKVACWSGSGGCTVAINNGASVTQYSTVSAMIDSVRKGTNEAVVYDYSALLYFQSTYTELSYSVVKTLDTHDGAKCYSINRASGNGSLDEMDCFEDALLEMKFTGDFLQLVRKWFPLSAASTAVWLSSPGPIVMICSCIAVGITAIVVFAAGINWCRERHKEKSASRKRADTVNMESPLAWCGQPRAVDCVKELQRTMYEMQKKLNELSRITTADAADAMSE